MSNSSLVNEIIISPNCSPRSHIIDTVTIHCMAADSSVRSCGEYFSRPSAKASSNYGIDSMGNVGLYVPEDMRSWCSSNRDNDDRAITIEVANYGGEPDWPVTAAALKKLIELLTDICIRNGIPKLLWKGDRSLVGQVEKQNMTVHRWFAAKACPGDYLYNLHGQIAEAVNWYLAERKGDKMDIQKLIDEMTPKQAAELVGKAQVYFSNQNIPVWAKGEYAKATNAHITDGSSPMAFVTRLEASLMAYRALGTEGCCGDSCPVHYEEDDGK